MLSARHPTPSEALPIRSRCLATAVLVPLLALALVQPALAQEDLGRVQMLPTPSTATAEPGGKALFRVETRSAHLLEQNVAFSAVAPAGWTYNFTPSNLTLAPGASGNVTLEVYAPPDAVVNTTMTLALEARSYGTDILLDREQVNVTVVAKPVSPTPAPKPPALSIAVTAASGPPGQTVEGVVTLTNADTSSLDVRLSGEGPAGWNPRFLAGDDAQVLHPGEAPRTVRVYATIPSAASPGSGQALALTATVGSFRFSATWDVTVLAPPTGDQGAATGPGSTNGGTGSGSTGDGDIPVIEPETRTALDLRVLESLLQIAPGGTATGTLRLENVGTTTLQLRIQGRGPPDWPAPTAERPTLSLEPGAATEVRFTLRAPEDVIPSSTGRGQGDLTVTSDSGLMRTVAYTVMVVPGAPRDESTIQDDAPTSILDPAAGADLPLGAIGLAAAFGAVGAGALALANRPLREKLLWAAVGLYTRLARPDVLGHEDREKLYRLVEQTPGIHFHALQRDLGWNTGTLTYHLRVLERHGFLVSRRDGLYRRFYLSGAAPRKEVFENQGPSGLRADVLEAIRNQHGMSQTDLALALGANKQTVNYHVKALERQGLIRLEKRGRETFLYPGNANSGMQGEARA